MGRGVRDPARLAALWSTGLLDAAGVPSFDRLTRLAARMLRVPGAQVSLIDADRQVAVSAVGSGRREVPLSHSFCRLVVEDGAPLVVRDARRDGRVRDNPAVDESRILAYAGYPLRTPGGEVLGAFCVIDHEPRDWSADELATVADFAGAAEPELALRAAVTRATHDDLDADRTFLQALMDSLDTGVVACDTEGTLVLVNRALRAVGHEIPAVGTAVPWAGALEFLAADGRTVLRPEQMPLARAFAGEHLHGEQVVLAIGPDARQRRFLCNGQPIDTPDGQRLGAVVALHDVTDAHRAERLRDAQHTVAEALTLAHSAKDAADAAVAAVTAALGWAFGEYWHVDPGTDTAVRLGAWNAPSRNRPAFTDDTARVGRGDGVIGHVWRTGRPQWIHDVATLPYPSPRRDAALAAGLHAVVGLPVASGGTVLGVLVFGTEHITAPDPDMVAMLDGVCAHIARHIERLRADDLSTALTTARRDFDRIIARVNDYLWTVEVTGPDQVTIVYASQGAGVLGPRVPAGVTLVDLIHPDDGAEFAAFHRTATGGEPVEIECRVVGTDGTTRWVWTRAVPRGEEGRLFVDGISTNTTDRHHIAEQREAALRDQQRQVDRLRELDRLKDDLVALVSHELRNPIGAILAYAEILLDDPDLTVDQSQYTEVIHRHSGHLQHLVDDLLDLARLDTGALAVAPRPLSLNRMLRQAVEDHRHAADARTITLHTDLPRDLAANADPLRLRQVLDNLLSNAVKYTQPGGTVTVTARDDHTGIHVDVTDSGIGIPADQYPHLFDRFFRASTATDRNIKGTGLGLAITRAIIDAHHGTITAYPATPHGTTFTFTLPTGGFTPGDSG